MYHARNPKTKHNCNVLFHYGQDHSFIVFDTETTGLDPESDYIIELAAIKYLIKNKKLTELERMDLFIKPPIWMDQKVVDIHGISNESLYDKPFETDCFQTIYDFFGDRPILVGQNTNFDLAMLDSMYQRHGKQLKPQVALDTLEMARDLISPREISDYKLQTLTDFFGVSGGLTFHCAIDDVQATSRILLCFYQEYQKQPDEPAPDIRLYINYMYFWKGFNKEQMGIYLNCDHGLLYYSTMHKYWCSKEIDLSRVDIEDLERQVLYRTNLKDIQEFGRLTEKKFKELKEARKKAGVRL